MPRKRKHIQRSTKRRKRRVYPRRGKKFSPKNFFLNLFIGVLSIIIIAFVYSWIDRTVFTEKRPEMEFITDKGRTESLTTKFYSPKKYRDVEIEVLNGCGVTGLAQRFTDLLREEGFDVVKTENAENFDFPETIVLDRSGKLWKSYRVARAIGIDSSNVIQQINEDLLLDVSVIIGKDYGKLEIYKKLLKKEE